MMNENWGGWGYASHEWSGASESMSELSRVSANKAACDWLLVTRTFHSTH